MPQGVLMMEERLFHAEAVSVLNSMVSQTDFNKGKAGEIFGRVQKTGRIVVLKNNKPSAIILSPEEYARLAETEEDLRLFSEAEARLTAHKDSDILDEGEVLCQLGLNEDELQSAPDVEIE